MTIRKLFFLFWTTLLIGGMSAPVIGGILQQWTGPIGLDMERQLWAGVMFGAVAQMGFFAYMVFNMVAVGFLRNQAVYQGLQLLLTLGALYQAAMWGWQKGDGPSLLNSLILPGMLLIAGLTAAWFKQKATKPEAFVPTVFFMVTATMLEAIPSLEQKSMEMVLFMVCSLLVCNAWQIMQLHRLVKDTPAGALGKKQKKLDAKA
ncbi:KinB-signaling pathway activation protein [Marinithermofilum abyssi]|uniref:KinB-signaling pathway activation protein n=1 Tax=Marinithermofilum abyssi TaxID=1571185 RepID=A0A8J2VH78_9BACL|nr:KinB-signaling pathway activation protein [Marinithermofilum abyssi]GGE20690.1 KinB-signaling pathway activation protein [Marinithermofilum abyssi]